MTRYGKRRREDRKKLKWLKNWRIHRIQSSCFDFFWGSGSKSQRRRGGKKRGPVTHALVVDRGRNKGEVEAALDRFEGIPGSLARPYFRPGNVFNHAVKKCREERRKLGKLGWLNRWEPSLTINGKGGRFKTNSESWTFDTPGIKTGEIKIFSFFFYDRRLGECI